jgi:hypothetical protein
VRANLGRSDVDFARVSAISLRLHSTPLHAIAR